MIELKQHKQNDVIPECDYLFDKTDNLDNLLHSLTPKFSGKWKIVLLEPTIKFTKDLIENTMLPKWVDFIILLSKAKLDVIILQYPDLVPKERTTKEIVDEAVIHLNNLIDEPAKKLLRQVFGKNEKDLQEALTTLDKDCTTGIITPKEVKELVHYEKKVYASEVINAFLTQDVKRWQMYNMLVEDLGMSYAYNALFSYVRKLIKEKNDYLNNKDVKIRITGKVDAPFICYAYTLFENSTNYNQLIGIMYSIDNRSKKLMERITHVNL